MIWWVRFTKCKRKWYKNYKLLGQLSSLQISTPKNHSKKPLHSKAPLQRLTPLHVLVYAETICRSSTWPDNISNKQCDFGRTALATMWDNSIWSKILKVIFLFLLIWRTSIRGMASVEGIKTSPEKHAPKDAAAIKGKWHLRHKSAIGILKQHNKNYENHQIQLPVDTAFLSNYTLQIRERKQRNLKLHVHKNVLHSEYCIIFLCLLVFKTKTLSHDMTKPTKWVCPQRRLRSAWASVHYDQSLRCALNG